MHNHKRLEVGFFFINSSRNIYFKKIIDCLPYTHINMACTGGSRILEKGGPIFPLAQTLFSICSKLLKKLISGGGLRHFFFQERQLREDLCRGRSVGSMSAERHLFFFFLFFFFFFFVRKKGGPRPIRPPGSATV